MSIGSAGSEEAICSWPTFDYPGGRYDAIFCSGFTGYSPSGFTTTFQANNWTQAAFIYHDATSKMDFYWNGVLVGSRTSDFIRNLLNTQMKYSYLGRSQYAQDGTLYGGIADIQFYDVALTSTHLANLYAGGDASGCPSSPLVLAMCPSTSLLWPSNSSNTILQLDLTGSDGVNLITCQQQCGATKGCVGIVLDSDISPAWNCELRNDMSPGSETGATTGIVMTNDAAVRCINNGDLARVLSLLACPTTPGTCTIGACKPGYQVVGAECATVPPPPLAPGIAISADIVAGDPV